MVRVGTDARQDYCPDGVRRDASGWVLGALNADDAWRFTEHLLTCRACQLTVAELQPAARVLLALPPLQPPEAISRDHSPRRRNQYLEKASARGSPASGD